MRFRFSPNTDTYDCLECDSSGRLPVVEGEAFCPHCGEHLWTVRRLLKESEFGPDYRLPIRDHAPPLKLKGRRFARLCVLLFPSLVRRWLNRFDKRANGEINRVFAQLGTCQRREDYQRLLGSPKYALSGKGVGRLCHGMIVDSPDVIECYRVGCCCVELYFRDNRLQKVSAFERLTALRFEMSRAERSKSANAAWPQGGIAG